MPTDTQIAWAAGLFEGEGTASINGKWNQPVVQLTTADLDVVQTFHEIVGVGNIHTPKRRGNNKQLYCWQVGAVKDCITVLTLLMPYLHSRRKERAEEVIAVAQTKRSRDDNLGYDKKEVLYALGLKERD